MILPSRGPGRTAPDPPRSARPGTRRRDGPDAGPPDVRKAGTVVESIALPPSPGTSPPGGGLPAPASRPRRIAITNEWFERTGGAERVLVAVAEALDGADTSVLWSDRDLDQHPGFRETWLARTPLRGHKALTLPLMPLVWRTHTRRRYDVVLSLSHSFNHTARLPVRPGGVHLSYVHTPARYVWCPDVDQRLDVPGRDLAIAAMKRLELRSNRHVDSYAANSETVRRRIRHAWDREARVIHPPCRTGFFAQAGEDDRSQDRDYLLALGRWVTYKRFDLAIEVAQRCAMPMVIAGGGPEAATLRRTAASATVPVRFVEGPGDAEVRRLLWGARALVYPCVEDFGIVPVEAQACGTPVVGLRAGGLLETVHEGVSGLLVDGTDPAGFARAVRETDRLDREAVRAHAERFSEKAFRDRIRAWVDDVSER